jgi:chorismate mutase
MTSPQELLQKYRWEINQIDLTLVELLWKRFEIVEKVGALKKEHNIETRQNNRFEELLNIVIEAGEKEGLGAWFLKNIWHEMHEYSIERQKKIL